MKYYAHIGHNNRLLGYYNDDLHHTIPEPNIELTYSQWQNCLSINANRISDAGLGEVFDFRTTEEKATDVRVGRDYILSEVVDPVVSNPLRWADLTEAKQAEWTQYRTDLLNITDQAGFPHNVTWPVKP